MSRISNQEAVDLIRRRQVFETYTGSMFGAYQYGPASLYIVCSYGWHFPMAVFDRQTGKWFYNADRYSPTTSRHQSFVRDALPYTYIRCTTEEINKVIEAEGRAYKLAQSCDGLRETVQYAHLIEALQP